MQQDIYRYQPVTDGFQLTLRERKSDYRHFAMRFPSARAERSHHQTATAELYLPHGEGPKPLAIILHGVGDFSLGPLNRAAARLPRLGIASCALCMVFNSQRHPPEIRERYPKLSDAEWREHYAVSITEVRQIVDWAATHPEIDEKRVALVGVSLGGFIGAITMGVDPRIKTGVLALMGGNSTKLIQRSRKLSLHREGVLSEAELAAQQARYAAYLERVRAEGFEAIPPDDAYYLTDPLTFAHLLRDRKLMMVNARWDEIIPRAATLDFWHAAGEPEIKWYPVNHVAFWLLAFRANRELQRFLQRELLNGV